MTTVTVNIVSKIDFFLITDTLSGFDSASHVTGGLLVTSVKYNDSNNECTK